MRQNNFYQLASELGFTFGGDIKHFGEHSELLTRHRDDIYISGLSPAIAGKPVFQGVVGKEITVEAGRKAAAICVLRAAEILKQELGSLDKVGKFLRISVYVQSADNFTKQREVSEGASQALIKIFGDAGRHVRTTVGVSQLPNNASVKIDFTLAARV